MSEEISFKRTLRRYGKNLCITIPESANTQHLHYGDEVVVWVRKLYKGGVHANEQV